MLPYEEEMKGQWELRVEDAVLGGTGTLRSWTLHVKYFGAAVFPTPTPMFPTPTPTVFVPIPPPTPLLVMPSTCIGPSGCPKDVCSGCCDIYDDSDCKQCRETQCTGTCASLALNGCHRFGINGMHVKRNWMMFCCLICFHDL